MCLLGVSLILFFILWVKYPQNTNFWGVNTGFQAKRAKYWKFHVIETTASILTKFGVTIDTTKWSLWVVPAGTQQVQDGGQPPFWKKPLNHHISATVRPILMKFSKVTDIGAWHRITVKKLWKSKMAAAAILKKSQKLRFSQLRFDLSLRNLIMLMQNGRLNLADR